ncbi:Peroxisomal bioproteinsis factor 3 [Elsinoe australis]|uniref:Peroxisomal bioproteinsis factor 3 n=1 Tax=Elsinoe australis TaxID=40998 RepID=A0A2P8A7U7_9PEZI|nr:Peroxisomal bioproteinsis factor 3 [Elsinoe australis]
MLERARQWFWRNRTRFAFGAAAVSGVYLAGQYAWGKWLEAQQRMGEERIAKENLRRRFEQNQEDCTYTVLALLPTVRDEVIGAFPVEEISTELQKQKAERLARSVGGLSEVASTDLPSGPPSAIDDSGSLNGSFVHASQMGESSAGGQLRPKKSKVQLWYDMKIQSITRSITLLYTLSLLTLLTRIQLNLLGRRTYLSSVVSLASPPQGQQASTISLQNNDDDNYDNVYGSDFETNRQYLTFSWWLLHRGCKDISSKVTQAVREVFGPMDPRADVTLEKLSELILEVRKKIEGTTELERQQQQWLPYLLPPKDQEEAVLREPGITPSPDSPTGRDLNPLDTPSPATKPPTIISPSLRRLLDETSDLIDSPTFTHVLTQLLNTTFSHLIDARVASEAFKLPRPTTANAIDPTNRITEITDRKVKLAQTLAVFCRQAHVIAAGSGDVDEISAAAAVEGGNVNEYLAAIDKVKDLEAFAAVIYSSNFEFESIQEEQRRLREQQSQQGLRGEGVDLPRVLAEQVVLGKEGGEEGQGMFESAWSKALDNEDGVKEGESERA